MKIIKVILGILIMMMAASCHSPSKDGNKAANMENECEENCIEAIRDLHREFTDDFTPSAYTSRRQALEEFERRLEEICDNYYLEINDVEIEKGLLRSPYIESNKGLEKFDEAYFRARNEGLHETILELTQLNPVPQAVISSINRVRPDHPDKSQIIKDLEGHSLSEGFKREACYFSEDWKKTIGDDVEITNLHIKEVLTNNSEEYIFIAEMTLKGEHISLKAQAQIYYSLPDGGDWKIDFVKSLGVRIVPSYKYDDCIRCVIEDDGWGGTYALFITNTSEVKLLVTGHIWTVTNDGKTNFSTVIPAGEKKQVGGLFCGGSVTNFNIINVERI